MVNSLYQKEWRKNNPEKFKKYQKKYYNKNRIKEIEDAKKWNKEHKEKYIANVLKWRKENPEKVKTMKRNYRLRHPIEVRKRWKDWVNKNKEHYKKWGKEYHNRPEVKKHYKEYMEKWHIKRREKIVGSPKPDICPVCKRKMRICVDHCHKTGKIRGWLCDSCNVALGRVDDRVDILKGLIKYLNKNR